jgi:hypothetical protein
MGDWWTPHGAMAKLGFGTSASVVESDALLGRNALPVYSKTCQRAHLILTICIACTALCLTIFFVLHVSQTPKLVHVGNDIDPVLPVVSQPPLDELNDVESRLVSLQGNVTRLNKRLNDLYMMLKNNN